MLRLIAPLLIFFKLWMLYDAYQRRAETFWYWIIIGIPGGSLLYFFMVRMRAPDAQMLQGRLYQSFRRPPSIEELSRRYEASPSLANRVALAQGLADASRYLEAKMHFNAVLEKRENECDALFGLGVCELELKNLNASMDAFEKVVEQNPAYRDYASYGELAHVYEEAGQRHRSIELLRQLVQRAPRLSHGVILAEYLIRAGYRIEAEQQLKRALVEHREAPRHVRSSGRIWARRARLLLDSRP